MVIPLAETGQPLWQKMHSYQLGLVWTDHVGELIQWLE